VPSRGGADEVGRRGQESIALSSGYYTYAGNLIDVLLSSSLSTAT
jgi:hypothetical protein